MRYKDLQYIRQIEFIENSPLFDNSKGNGYFMGKERAFVLQTPTTNLYKPIRELAIKYFKENNIDWWRGNSPSGHTLSSQISCLNHLMPIMKDNNAVLAIINSIKNEFVTVHPINCDTTPRFIAFEVVSSEENYLNERNNTRGANCTSVDALVLAEHISGRKVLIPIEWKYTEAYENFDKSTEGENKARGLERQRRYNELITQSAQLKSMATYEGSVYYQEPFYQLMRQTLWAEQMVQHNGTEIIKADDYFHIHVIPKDNRQLLAKRYKVSGNSMEETWRGCLHDNTKYHIIDPATLLSPLESVDKYRDLLTYLRARYW